MQPEYAVKASTPHWWYAGLDSTTAMHLVATLRQLAQGGRAILTTIHQPSSRLYQMLDKLLLLSEGYALFPSKRCRFILLSSFWVS